VKVVLLAGGTGGARFATGLRDELPPGELTVVTNPGDDIDAWGLRVCPDADAVLFRLAGIFNDRSGYGIVDDTSTVLGQLQALGEDTWFHLGDRDLAFHVLRSHWLRQGGRLTDVMLEVARRLRVATRVLPATDHEVRTHFHTDAGRLAFQDYFVRLRLRPALRAIELTGIEDARPTPEVLTALEAADLIVIGPSNPLISIEPILRVLGEALPVQRTVAITPVVGGRALKGPTVEMLRAIRGEATPEAVARGYRTTARWFVLDAIDADRRAAVEQTGCQVLVMDTVMGDGDGSRRLARELLGHFR
jgi:LPPG:FO 2-phospho-L-lactate transferase